MTRILSPQQIKIVALRQMGLSYQDIANELEVNIGTIYQQYRRALQKNSLLSEENIAHIIMNYQPERDVSSSFSFREW